MTQLLHPVDPFGEVNVHRRPDGSLQIVATVLMEPDIEGARCGLALDGSASMKRMYGVAGVVSPIFASCGENVVQPVTRAMAAYLARFSSSGTVNLAYWACGPDGAGIEDIAEVDHEQAKAVLITGPKKQPWGRQTKLLPVVRHFVDGLLRPARWGICVIVTDGRVEDLDEVKKFSWEFARQIAAGQRNFIKLVLIGVGAEVDEEQMTQLDGLFEQSSLVDPKGDPIDLWDHKLAREMRHLQEVFSEVVSEKVHIAPRGRILDGMNRPAVEYREGVPALLRFSLPAGSLSFTLEVSGQRVTQDISEVLAPTRT